MYSLSQKNSIVIELVDTKKEYFVTFKPYKKKKEVFIFEKIEEAYRHILRFLMGYLTGCSEVEPLNHEKLSVIITTLSLVFDIDIQFIES